MQFIGIDAAKATFDIALPLSHGKYRTKAKLPNTPKGFDELLAWRAKHAPNAVVGMEATGIYHEALAQALVEAGVVVHVANPARVKAFGQAEGMRTKTDRSDAKLIARFFEAQRSEKLYPYVPPTPSEVKLRALVRRRDDLQEMLQMEHNRLDVADISVQQGIKDVIRTLEEQIKQVQKAIEDHIDNDPDLRRRHQLLNQHPRCRQHKQCPAVGHAGGSKQIQRRAPGGCPRGPESGPASIRKLRRQMPDITRRRRQFPQKAVHAGADREDPQPHTEVLCRPAQRERQALQGRHVCSDAQANQSDLGRTEKWPTL